MLLVGMTRLPEGAVGNDLFIRASSSCGRKRMFWSARIEKRDIPDTHWLTPPPPPSPPPPPLQHPVPAHTSGWQIVNLASLELMFFSTPLILIRFQSPPFSPSLSPSLSLSLLLLSIFLCFPSTASSLSLPLYRSFSPTCSWGSKHQIEHLGNRCHLGKCWSSSRLQ